MSDGKIHSELGASGYYRWKACPGSVRLCRDMPKTSSKYADQGTYAHAMAANILTNDPNALGLDRPSEWTEEDMEAIDVYVKHIEEVRSWGPSFEAVEQEVDLKEYHPKLHGTLDHVAYFADSKTLRVTDYKHGAGVPVDVKASPQLSYYALGALIKNNFPIKDVILTIVQPRCYHPDGPIRGWRTTPEALLDFLEELIQDAKKTEDPEAKLHPGDHCRFCAAGPLCPAIRDQALTSAKEVFSAIGTYSPEALAKALSELPQIEGWCKNVRSFAYREAEAGRIPPGFKLVPKRPMRRWIDDKEEVKWALGDLFHLNNDQIFEPADVRSPAQIEKFLSKEQKPLLSQLIVKESSGKNLVPATGDDREAIDVVAEAFPD